MSGRRRTSSDAATQPGLSDRQRRFVDEYLIDFNIAAAARRSGYAASTSHAPDRLLTPAVNAAIEAAMDDRARRTRLRADLVVTELARLAFANLHDFIEVAPDGTPRIDFRRVQRMDAAAIQSITVDYFRPTAGARAAPVLPCAAGEGDREAVVGAGGRPGVADHVAPAPRRVRITLHDKRACLWDLARHLGVTPAGPADAAPAEPQVTFQRIVTGVPRAHDPDGAIGKIWRTNPDGSVSIVTEQDVIAHYLPRGQPRASE